MSDSNVKHISFLFGAGAEAFKENYSMPLGLEFLRRVFYDANFKSEVTEALGHFFSDQYYDKTVSYRSDTIDAVNQMISYYLIEKSKVSEDFFLIYKSDIQQILSKTNLDKIKSVYKDSNKVTDADFEHIESTESKIKEEFSRIVSGEIRKYSEITEQCNKDIFVESADDSIEIDYSLGLSNLLDGYFHTIVDPKKYGVVKFFRVFNFYWLCYFCVAESVLKEYGSSQLYLDFIDDGKLKYKKVLENIDDFNRDLYELVPNRNKETYYNLIDEQCKDSKYKCEGIATTNYYRFCDVITSNVAYLNGQLKYMEYPERLEVLDYDSYDKDKCIFFPFIFGQSMVKPIIDNVQIEQFKMFDSILAKSDVLCVLGYNINVDDNHVNEYLHSHVKKGKRLIVVIGLKDKKDIHLKLKCNSSQIEYCTVNYSDMSNAEIIDALFKMI